VRTAATCSVQDQLAPGLFPSRVRARHAVT
jgi:hypothetical protein